MEGLGEGITSLVGLSGVQVPGRARFIGSFLGVTAYSSLTTGAFFGQLGAVTPVGPLLPFLVGSWIGYTAGCVQVWKRGRADAVSIASKYPKLLSYTLATEFDMETPADGGEPLEKWICQTTGRMSWAILAAQSCKPGIAELEDQVRQRVFEEYAEAES